MAILHILFRFFLLSVQHIYLLHEQFKKSNAQCHCCWCSFRASSMFPKNIQTTVMALHYNYCRQHRQILFNFINLIRTRPVCCGVHGTAVSRKQKPEISSEPVKFTSSPANTPSKIKLKDVNKYQGLIVCASLSVFMLYFFILREENDIDEKLNMPLFEQVPSLEEPHLRQMIPQMRARNLDTSEVEARLKVLVDKRLAKEQQEMK